MIDNVISFNLLEDCMREKLYEKITKEFKNYIKDLKTKDVDYIIDRSYETAIKEEMIYCFDPNSRYFSDEQIKILNKSSSPLNELYSDWISNDFSIGDEIRESINEYLFDVLSKIKEKNRER